LTLSETLRNRLNELEARKLDLEEKRKRALQRNKGISYELSQESELNDVWLSPSKQSFIEDEVLIDKEDLAKVLEKINQEILSIVSEQTDEIQAGLSKLSNTTDWLVKFSEETDKTVNETRRLLDSLQDATEILAVKSEQTNKALASLNETTQRLIKTSLSQNQATIDLGKTAQHLRSFATMLLVFVGILGLVSAFSLTFVVSTTIGYSALRSIEIGIVVAGILALVLFLTYYFLIQDSREDQQTQLEES